MLVRSILLKTLKSKQASSYLKKKCEEKKCLTAAFQKMKKKCLTTAFSKKELEIAKSGGMVTLTNELPCLVSCFKDPMCVLGRYRCR